MTETILATIGGAAVVAFALFAIYTEGGKT